VRTLHSENAVLNEFKLKNGERRIFKEVKSYCQDNEIPSSRLNRHLIDEN